MPRRKTTWALILWTLFFVWWGTSYAGALGGSCEGRTGAELDACEAGTAIGGGIGFTALLGLWFLGFIVLSVVWFATRPRPSVTVHGPQGQQAMVTEAEARRRVRDGWTYQPGVPVDPATVQDDPLSWPMVIGLIVVMAVGALIVIGALTG